MVNEYNTCPRCKNDLIFSTDPEYISDGCVIRFKRCNNCRFEWVEHFHIALNANTEGEPIDENADPVRRYT